MRLAWSRPGGRLSKAGVAVTAAITLLAACSSGGSSRLSKPEYVRRADAICRQANKKAGAVPAPDQHEPTAQEKAIGEIIVIQRAAVVDLRHLAPPEADKATLGKWLGLVNQTVDQMQAVRTALEGRRQRRDHGRQCQGTCAQRPGRPDRPRLRVETVLVERRCLTVRSAFPLRRATSSLITSHP